jgi:hypothetical protein
VSDADKTPVDKRSTIEMFAEDMRATKVAAESTANSQVEMHEAFKGVLVKLETFEKQLQDDRQRTWLPALIAVAAALFSFACAVAATTAR